MLLFVTTSSFGQVLKLKSTAIAYQYQDENNQWEEWTDFEETSVLIVMNLNEERITIYSQETQVYDIVQSDGETKDSDGDEFLSLRCVNEDGINCTVRLATLYSDGGRSQLYINFSNMVLVYNVYSLD
jgi:hypothetical protein